MPEVPLSHDGPLLIENTHLVLFRAQSTPTNHAKVSSVIVSLPFIRAVTTPAIPVLALEGATSYWASVVANPPGHMSVFGASKRGVSLVAPGGPARPVSLRRV